VLPPDEYKNKESKAKEFSIPVPFITRAPLSLSDFDKINYFG
jgi:hypothetical protein